MIKKIKTLFGQNEMTDLAKKARFQPKTVLQLLLFVAVFVAANTVSGIITGIPTGILTVKKLAGLTLPAADNYSGYLSSMTDIATEINNDPWIKIISLFGTAFTTAAAIIFCTKIEKRSAASMGFHKQGSVKKYLLGYVLGLVMLAVTSLLNFLCGGLKFTLSSGFDKMLPLMLLIFVGYMVQGMSEEVLVRGYLQMTLSIHKKQWFAVLVSAFVFAALHLANPGLTFLAFFNIFLFGAVMSLLLLETKSIWLVGALHSAWNFAQGHLFGISVSGTGTAGLSVLESVTLDGKQFINGGSFGVEGGICTTVVLLIAIVAILFSNKVKETPAAEETV